MFTWVLIVVSIFMFLVVSEVSWRVFLWTFKIIDTYLQDQHMAQLQKKWNMPAHDLGRIYEEPEEMAA